jgi:hypothetical protein
VTESRLRARRLEAISSNIGSYSAATPAARRSNNARRSRVPIPRTRANVSAKLSISPRTIPFRASHAVICSTADGPERCGTAVGGILLSSFCSLLMIVFIVAISVCHRINVAVDMPTQRAASSTLRWVSNAANAAYLAAPHIAPDLVLFGWYTASVPLAGSRRSGGHRQYLPPLRPPPTSRTKLLSCAV